MTPPDEIAALAAKLERASLVGSDVLSNLDLLNAAKALRLSATSGDAVRPRGGVEPDWHAESIKLHRQVKALRKALQEQHDWHLAQGDRDFGDGIVLDMAEAYSDGSMCERTTAILSEVMPSGIEGYEAWKKAALAPAEKPGDEWRCFHCDEVFNDAAAARDHFGDDCTKDAACRLAERDGGLVRLIREQEDELRRFRSEDTASSREFYALGAEHAAAMRREEEKGYARGVEDMKRQGFCVEPERHAATPTPPSADVANYTDEQIEDAIQFIDFDVALSTRAEIRQFRHALQRLIQSAAHGGGTEGGVEVVSASKETAMRMRGMSPSDPPAQEAVTEPALALWLWKEFSVGRDSGLSAALISTFNITRKP